MAQLDVQPKHKGPFWIWIVVGLVVIGIIFMLFRGCNKSYRPTALKTNGNDSTLADTTKKAKTTVDPGQPDWDNVEFTLPKSTFDEISDTSVVIRSNANYSIYGLGGNILFGTGESTLQNSADVQLKLIAASLNKRFKNGNIGIYGRTDSTGTVAVNTALAEKRAVAVKEWLVAKAGFASAMITIHALGEAKPLANNGTTSGRQQNRSVEIVAFRDTLKN
ncbi:hypothetical protein A0256_17500 [Mucilaginibacter sp. PAMC 26640]|nr:hypothetical protein A0256_17500 [Mucilaginibacter sp. PAMC 26640]